MTELCFSTSSSACLKMLRAEGKLPLGETIAALSEDLTLGDIRSMEPEARRRALRDAGVEADPEEEQAEAYRGFLNAIECGTDFRLWCSGSAYERAALAYACALLSPRVQQVRLCAADLSPVGAVSTAELDGAGWRWLAGRERTAETAPYAAEWRVLAAENAPLRVVENGVLRSAPPDYYDAPLREKLTRGGDAYAAAVGVMRAVREREGSAVSIEFLWQRAKTL